MWISCSEMGSASNTNSPATAPIRQRKCATRKCAQYGNRNVWQMCTDTRSMVASLRFTKHEKESGVLGMSARVMGLYEYIRDIGCRVDKSMRCERPAQPNICVSACWCERCSRFHTPKQATPACARGRASARADIVTCVHDRHASRQQAFPVLAFPSLSSSLLALCSPSQPIYVNASPNLLPSMMP